MQTRIEKLKKSKTLLRGDIEFLREYEASMNELFDKLDVKSYVIE